METSILDVIQGRCNSSLGVTLCEVVDDRGNGSLIGNLTDVRVVSRKSFVEQCLTQGGVHGHRTAGVPFGCFTFGEDNIVHTNADLGVEIQRVLVHGQDCFCDRGECATFTGHTFLDRGQVVQTNNHVLRRQGHGATIRWLQDVVRGQHQDASFSLSFN